MTTFSASGSGSPADAGQSVRDQLVRVNGEHEAPVARAAQRLVDAVLEGQPREASASVSISGSADAQNRQVSVNISVRQGQPVGQTAGGSTGTAGGTTAPTSLPPKG